MESRFANVPTFEIDAAMRSRQAVKMISVRFISKSSFCFFLMVRTAGGEDHSIWRKFALTPYRMVFWIKVD